MTQVGLPSGGFPGSRGSRVEWRRGGEEKLSYLFKH